MITLTVVAENSPHPDRTDLVADHGFAALAELDDQTLLYDFGPEGSLTANAHALGIDLASVDVAVLSHGHHDHAGGLGAFLSANDRATVYHGRGAFHPRWSISGGPPKEIGVPLIPTEDVVARLRAVDLLDDRDKYVLLPAAPGYHPKPKGNGALLTGSAGARLQDDFTDEVTVVLRGPDGLVVLTGCSHRGILNIAEQVRTYCPDCPVSAVIGGFHLRDGQESEDEVGHIGEALDDKFPDARIITGHCTDKHAAGVIHEVFGDRYEGLHVGKVMEF